MTFVLLSRSKSRPQGSVKPVSKRQSARVQSPSDLCSGFGKPVFQPPITAMPTVPVIQTKLKIGEPNDKFEREADRVADTVMKMPESLPPGTAMSTPARVYPSSAIQPRRIECFRSGGLCPQCTGNEKIESNTPAETATALIQRKVGEINEPDAPNSPKAEDKKAEIEFHSALHFNRTFSGFNPTGEPKEGEYPIIWWRVWNTGWKTAPEHYDRLTIYKANICSGCRNEKDEFFRLEMLAPSIVSITQQGESDYESAYLIGMTLHVGHYDAYVDLDVHNDVEEINEDNNTAFMTFDVKPSSESESTIEGEETIRPKKDTGSAPGVGPSVESQISTLRSRGQPLPQSLRSFFEPRFGYDFSHVRVHTDENAVTSARAINAQAYTIENDIVFGPGRFDPNTAEGRRLLAHELTHVVQQSGGHAPRAVARQPEKAPPKAPKCHTGCAGHWGQDTTCSKWGFHQGLKEREPQYLIEVKGKKLKLTPCCNSWPFAVETYARDKLGIDGAASCKWNHEKEIATVTAGNNSVQVLCSDTICETPEKCGTTFGESTDAKACAEGSFSREVIELSPKAMEKLSGSQVATLQVSVCYSGTKQDLCPHSGPGKASFPEVEHCLTDGCTPPDRTPKLKDTGWPRS